MNEKFKGDKMVKKCNVISVIALLFVVPMVLAAEAPSPQQQVSLQQFTLVVQKQNDQLKKDIVANQDENFKTFDARVNAMLSGFLRKLIVGLLGGMTVILVGYAAIISYVSNKFTPAFQRNLFRQKVGSAVSQGKMMPQGSVMRVDAPIVVQKEGQVDSLKSKPAPVSTYKVSGEPDFSGFNFSAQVQQATEPVVPSFQQEKKSGGKKVLVFIIILVFVILAYLSARYYLTHMGVSLPNVLGNLTGGK
jgi:hypothetical protein